MSRVMLVALEVPDDADFEDVINVDSVINAMVVMRQEAPCRLPDFSFLDIEVLTHQNYWLGMLQTEANRGLKKVFDEGG